MKRFSGSNALGQLATAMLAQAAFGYKTALVPTLDEIGAAVKAEVQREIGEYQSGIGQYSDTAPLADSTIEKKQKSGTGKGGNPDSPLWETGAFHDDINFKSDVVSLTVEIGTNKPYVKFTELGTRNMPARPVFGPSTLRALPPLLPALAMAAAMGVSGGAWSGLGVQAMTRVRGRDVGSVAP